MNAEPEHEQPKFFDAEWKAELRLHVDTLSGLPFKYQGSLFPAERAVQYSALIVRKLIEHLAVTDVVRSRSIDVTEHTATSDRVAKMLLAAPGGDGSIDRHFGMTNGKVTRLDCQRIANEIIHSQKLGWRSFGSFAVCSRDNEDVRLFSVPLGAYIVALSEVIDDAPTKWEQRYVRATGKYTVKVS